MPNPTGPYYLVANTAYQWTDGDVYRIDQQDQLEGFGVGASFGGLGVDNDPHQSLLDKVTLVHTNQLTDEANIGELLGFTGLAPSDANFHSFVTAYGTPNSNGSWSGYLQLSNTDAQRGLLSLILQFGGWNVSGYSGLPPTPIGPGSYEVFYAFNFPTMPLWVLITPCNVAAVPSYNSPPPQVGSVGAKDHFSLFVPAGSLCAGVAWAALGF